MIESLARQWALVPQDDPLLRHGRVVHEARGFALVANELATVAIAAGGERTVCVLGAATIPSDPSQTMDGIARLLASSGDVRGRICDLAGCYAVIVWNESGCVAYTDPASIIGLYHTDDARQLASTPALLGEPCIDPQIESWFAANPQNNWIPGPATLVAGVRAVPANCSFRMGTGAIERFWPLPEDLSPPGRDPVAVVADDIRGACEAVAHDDRSIVLSITGGYDSRVCLAGARHVLDQCSLFTLRPSEREGPDVTMARELASLARQPHRVIDCPEATSEQIAAFDRLCAGQVRGAAREVIGGSARVAEGPAIHVGGGLGAVLKNYYGPKAGSRQSAVKPSELLTDFAGPPASIVRSVEQWLDSVSDLPPQLQRTLMYVEQRTARWGGPTELGSSLFYDPFTPFCSRRVILAAAFAEDELLERGRFHQAVIERLWPELVSVGFTRARSPMMRLVPRGLKERLRPLKRVVEGRLGGR